MKKIFFFILGFFTISLFSQSYYDNLEKYWYYRQRFNKYFIKIGTNSGESIPMDMRGYNDSHPSHQQFDWGQSTIHLGEYIGVLATEYYLLKNHGYYEQAEQTREELRYALLAAKRKDIATENWPLFQGCEYEQGFDGFFLRDDVPADFDTSGLNYGLTCTDFDEIIANHLEGTPNICNEVHSGYTENIINLEDNLESQDEAIGLYLGLALVARCLPHSSYEYELAKTIADKIFIFLENNNFKIKPPCHSNLHPAGYNSQWFEYGWSKAASWITGNEYGHQGPNAISKWTIVKNLNLNHNDPTIGNGGSNADAERMAATLGVIGDSWWNPTIGGGPENVTKEVTIYKTNDSDWEPYYLFLWKFLHNKSDNLSEFITEAKHQLNSAPACGPYYYYVNGQKYFVEGWASSGKYYCNRLKQNGEHEHQNAWQGAFNGTDYMLMFNLYTLVTNNSMYDDLIDRKIYDKIYPLYKINNVGHIDYVFDHATHTFHPHFVLDYIDTTFYYGFSNPGIKESFETIETNMVVDTVAHYYNDPSNTITGHKGHVTLRAGKKIHLKPGFHAKKGSFFHAYIQPFTCSNNTIHSPGNNYDTLFADNQNVVKIEYNDIDPVNDTYPYELMEKLDSLRNTNPSMTDDSFVITPNPNNGQFKISAPAGIQNATIYIYNSNGILVYQSTVESFPANIDLSNESNGLYMVKIQTENNVSIIKFLKE